MLAKLQYVAAMAGSLLLACSAGLMLGWQMGDLREPVREIPDSRPLVPTLVLRGIRDGQLWGAVAGDLRLFVGDVQVHVPASGTLLAPAGVLLTHERTLRVPQGMRYVASRKGSRFYPVESAPAQRIAPQNRVYFPDAASARAAGYR